MDNIMVRIFLQNLATALPLLLVWLVGIVLAFIHWKKSPQNSLFTILGIVVLTFDVLLELTWNFFGVRWVNTNPDILRMARTLNIVIPLTFNLLKAGGWIFILLAIFVKPKKKPVLEKPEMVIEGEQVS